MKEVSAIDKFVAMQQRYIDASQQKSEVLAQNTKHVSSKPDLKGAQA